MNASESSATFEICPRCSQRTASQYFRDFKTTRLCNLCAHRAEKDEASLRAHIEDRKIHGGLGWLWKHVFDVAGRTFLGFSLFSTARRIAASRLVRSVCRPLSSRE